MLIFIITASELVLGVCNPSSPGPAPLPSHLGVTHRHRAFQPQNTQRRASKEAPYFLPSGPPESSVVDEAVSCRHHPVVRDKRSPAQMALAQSVETHLPGPFTLFCILAPNNTRLPAERPQSTVWEGQITQRKDSESKWGTSAGPCIRPKDPPGDRHSTTGAVVA